jgi:hypothetical protein
MDMLIDNLEPLLLETKVDVAVWGHNHVMQRFCLLENRTCTQHSHAEQAADGSGLVNVFDVQEYAGVLHLVLGAAGASFTRNVHEPWLPMTENAFYEFGYGRFFVKGNETLLWQWLDNDQPVTTVRDAVLLRRTAPPPQAAPSDGDHVGAIVGGSIGALAVLLVGFVLVRRARRAPTAGYAPIDEASKVSLATM